MQSKLWSRKTLLLVLVIVGIFCGSVFAYLTSLPSPERPMATITLMPFEFSTSLDKSVYSLHDNMTINFSLRNISNETVTIGKGSMDFEGLGLVTTESEGVTIGEGYPSRLVNALFHFGYILFDSNQTVIDESLEGIEQTGYVLLFEPNASLNQTIALDLATYELIGNATPPFATIQKGSYQISGAIYGYLPNVEDHTLETQPINFTIR